MKKKTNFGNAIALLALSLISLGCSAPAPVETIATEPVAAKPDMAAIKSEIQALETAWAAADNAGNVSALLAFYGEDAVSMGSDAPMAVGKAAIKKELEASMASKPAGSTISYETLEVFGDEKLVTEVGKITRVDASGKVISTGKYMAIWEKRDGKYICIRDIGNNDSKAN
jgi:uncharacterized protein (TIGR02246 family)